MHTRSWPNYCRSCMWIHSTYLLLRSKCLNEALAALALVHHLNAKCNSHIISWFNFLTMQQFECGTQEHTKHVHCTNKWKKEVEIQIKKNETRTELSGTEPKKAKTRHGKEKKNCILSLISTTMKTCSTWYSNDKGNMLVIDWIPYRCYFFCCCWT